MSNQLKRKRNIKTVEQDGGLWFVYERNGVGEWVHKVSIFDKGCKCGDVPNEGYQVVEWNKHAAPYVYSEHKHFWTAVHQGLLMARQSCNY